MKIIFATRTRTHPHVYPLTPLLKKCLLWTDMKLLYNFKSIKKMFFSPEFYFNRGSTFHLRPREKALLLFTGNTKSNHSTNQYKVKFTRSHFYVKKPSYKFTICLQNVSKNRKIICKTGCPLTLLLENKSIHHFYSNISLKDVREAHLFQTEF